MQKFNKFQEVKKSYWGGATVGLFLTSNEIKWQSKLIWGHCEMKRLTTLKRNQSFCSDLKRRLKEEKNTHSKMSQ